VEAIQAARQEKAQHLAPDAPSKLEQRLLEIRERRLIERLTEGVNGLGVRLGGLTTGSGFAAGPQYQRQDIGDGHFILRGSARASLKRYQLFDLEMNFPKLARDTVFVGLYAVHRNYPRVDYYGPGPDSAKTGRSNFRLEDTAHDVSGGVKPWRYLKLGGSAGYLQVNVGPGADRRFVSTDKIFSPALAPGIDRQADFLRGSVFAQLDWRDNPGGPRQGGNCLVRFWTYSDRKFGSYSFRRLDLEVQQYLPFANRRRVIALRGKSVLTHTSDGDRVPFYLQPTLGGSDDLRGFRSFRFYGDNLLVLNAEYRWESFSGLDMAIFADAGKVFPRHAQWNLKDLEGTVGFGFRFNIRNNVFMRLDVGFSHEGHQIWLKFDNVF
jgi:outer membrane protein assembly factor BamA